MNIEDKIIYCLNEKKLLTYEEGIELIKEECSDILKVYKKTDRILYRGTGSHRLKVVTEGDGIYKVIPRKTRKPKDTAMKVHTMIDKLFYERFGWKPRSQGVFATSYSGSGMYGTPYAFFPVNGYEYVWSPDIDDLYTDVMDEISLGISPTGFKYMNERGWWRSAKGDNIVVDLEGVKNMKDYDYNERNEDEDDGKYGGKKVGDTATVTLNNGKKVKYTYIGKLTKTEWLSYQENVMIDVVNKYTNTNLVKGLSMMRGGKEFVFKTDLCYLITPPEGGYTLEDYGF